MLIILAAVILLVVGAFVYCEINKVNWDRKVNEMCKIDGGIKIYDEILFSEMEYTDLLNQYGELYIPDEKFAKQTHAYYQSTSREYVNKGNPMVWRSEYRLIRRDDEKILATTVFYTRRGGDFIGPWHESSHSCPNVREIENMINLVFTVEK